MYLESTVSTLHPCLWSMKEYTIRVQLIMEVMSWIWHLLLAISGWALVGGRLVVQSIWGPGIQELLVGNAQSMGGTTVRGVIFGWDSKYAGSQVLLSKVRRRPPNRISYTNGKTVVQSETFNVTCGSWLWVERRNFKDTRTVPTHSFVGSCLEVSALNRAFLKLQVQNLNPNSYLLNNRTLLNVCPSCPTWNFLKKTHRQGLSLMSFSFDAS